MWLDRFASSLPAGTLVLDLGAGPGFDSAELRARGLEAICVDLSLGMLRAGAREFPGPRVQSDIRRLPFPSRSICGIWANASLLHLSESEARSALDEIRRVLRPPGILHVSVKRGTGAEWESERYGKPRWFQYWSDARPRRPASGCGIPRRRGVGQRDHAGHLAHQTGIGGAAGDPRARDRQEGLSGSSGVLFSTCTTASGKASAFCPKAGSTSRPSLPRPAGVGSGVSSPTAFRA